MSYERPEYVVAISEPDLSFHPVRYTLDDAREVAAKHNAHKGAARFASLRARIWKIARDGSLTEVQP